MFQFYTDVQNLMEKQSILIVLCGKIGLNINE